eukprot:15070909-Alexandrium_andersonii.AAC.1
MHGEGGKGIIRRQGERAFLGLLGVQARGEENEGAAMWRVKGTPQWRVEDLLSWFKDFGWTGVVVLSPPKGKMGWLIRGKPNRGGGSVARSDSGPPSECQHHQ